MADRRQSVRLQRRIGVLIAVMAAAIAIAPLALAIVLHNTTDSRFAPVLVVATLLWMLAFAVYRGLSIAHERWRRKVLRREIADIRQARLESSEAFQDGLNQQTAILERIIDIAETLLTDGIIDPITALENVRAVASHAEEAMGLAEDAIAEVRIETGATSFDVVTLDIRTEIEGIVAPFVRSGHGITTSGPQQFAESDPAVLRVVLRNLITKAIENDAQEIDVSIARDEDRVVCTVSDYNTDRSDLGLGAISPVSRSLAAAIDATFDIGYALGWNHVSLSLPAVENRRGHVPLAAPMDVLGPRSASAEPVAPETARLVEMEPRIKFTINADDADAAPGTSPEREPLQAR